MRIAPPDSAVSELLPSVVTFLKSPGMLIGSETLAATTGETFAVFNPATGAELARVPAGTASDVDHAVKAAQAAFEGPWSQMLPVQRQGLMLKLADLIEQNGEELAQLETLNQGKSILLSRLIEVQSSAEYIRYMAGWSTKIQGTTLDVSIPIPPGMRYQAFTRKEAVGVVAAITPWNFP
ncbi:MAG TPA: aldehyde dehydrogenase, partial [Gemmobacter sp.]|nr:aldehyde dehydrogenase [Gemmobacter sp.]